MNFVKIIYEKGSYNYHSTDSREMAILGLFLSSDVIHPSSFINWTFDNESDHACANLTNLDKEEGYILMSDLYSEEETPTELKMTQKQFVQILTDWEEKVLKLKPKEVIIKHKNDEFVIETKN
jgi:hypothetical protein